MTKGGHASGPFCLWAHHRKPANHPAIRCTSPRHADSKARGGYVTLRHSRAARLGEVKPISAVDDKVPKSANIAVCMNRRSGVDVLLVGLDVGLGIDSDGTRMPAVTGEQSIPRCQAPAKGSGESGLPSVDCGRGERPPGGAECRPLLQSTVSPLVLWRPMPVLYASGASFFPSGGVA